MLTLWQDHLLRLQLSVCHSNALDIDAFCRIFHTTTTQIGIERLAHCHLTNLLNTGNDCAIAIYNISSESFIPI